MIKDIVGYNGKYKIDENGNVFTVRRQGTDDRMLSVQETNSGYLCVNLRNGKTKKKELIHRLVAASFLRKPDGKDFVNHKDGNKKNNNFTNLEWVTRSENMKHAYKNGLSKLPMLRWENHPCHKLSFTSVAEIRSLYEIGVSSVELSRKYGVTKEQIMNIIKRKHWKVEGNL